MNQNALAANFSSPNILLERLHGLENASGILVAVSGGSDSVGLLALIAHWRLDYPDIPIVCATVDHGLREGASADVQHVAHLSAGFAIPHVCLTWEGAKPTSGIEEAAREARYRLLCTYAREHNLSHLVTAHTQEDQAETILLRLASGSGLSGLSGMQPVLKRAGIVHVRPLLSLTRQQLENIALQAGLSWRHDPMNDDAAYARVRLRQSRAVLEREGLTSARLSRLAMRMRRADAALEMQAQTAFEALFIQDNGCLMCDAQAFMAQPEEIELRLLLKVIRILQPSDVFGHLSKCEVLLEALRHAIVHQHGTARTLMGVKFTVKTAQKRWVLCGERAPERRIKADATLS